jgi:hypothetical protein
MNLQASGDNITGGGWRLGAWGVALAKVRKVWLVWGWIGIFSKCFPVENCYFTVLLQDFILECKGRTGYLCMVGTSGGLGG